MQQYKIEPLRILLVQNSEHSMDIMKEKLEMYAAGKGVRTYIKSVYLDDVWDNLTGIDAILLDPRLDYAERGLRRMVRDEIPVFCIEAQYFGPAPVNHVWRKMMDEMEEKSVSLSGPF